MNNIERNQENENKNPQGQGGRTEETREGRETMRGAGSADGENRNLSAGAREEEDIDDIEDTDDLDEASLDDASEDEDEMDLGGTERSDLGFNRGGRDGDREQSNQI